MQSGERYSLVKYTHKDYVCCNCHHTFDKPRVNHTCATIEQAQVIFEDEMNLILY